MDLKDLPQLYAAYQKKYTLPSYAKLNKEFEFLYMGHITALDFPLRFIRRRIADRLAGAVNYLQTILQPNPGSFVLLRESSFFSAEDKQKVSNLLQQFILLERGSFVLEVSGEEKDDAVYIQKTFKSWLTLKKDYAALVKLLPEGWKQQAEEKKPEKNQYMG